MFTQRTSWSVWELAGIKATVMSIGIIVGAYWAPFLSRYDAVLWGIAIVGAIWVMTVWFRQLHR